MKRHWKECELCSYKEHVEQKNIIVRQATNRILTIPWENVEKIWPTPHNDWQLLLERTKQVYCSYPGVEPAKGRSFNYTFVDLGEEEFCGDVLFDAFGQSFYVETVKCLSHFTDVRDVDFNILHPVFVRLKL